MNSADKTVAGPRHLVLAALVFGALLAAFFAGYQLGKTVGRDRAVGEAGLDDKSGGAQGLAQGEIVNEGLKG